MGSRGRILILNERDLHHPRAGGAEIHVARVFGRLAAQGFEVFQLAAGFPGAPEREQVAGIEVHRLGPLPRYYARVGPIARQETRSGRYDVLVECLNKIPFYAPLYAAVPVVALCHHLFGEVAFRQRPWPVAAAVWLAERPISRIYRHIPFVAISESSRDDLIRRGVDGSRVRVIHCGIDPPAAPGEPMAGRAERVVYVGRLEPYKNVDVLLRAMARLAERLPAAEILVVGEGAARRELEALAERLGLAERTTFTGFVSDRERDALLASARVCVFPSDKEGWGLTVIEANGVGTPVVASDVPGLRDSVRHGETGFLVACRDVTAFAEHVGRLVADPALAERMSSAALAWARRFDWDAAATAMAEVLEDARRSG